LASERLRWSALALTVLMICVSAAIGMTSMSQLGSGQASIAIGVAESIPVLPVAQSMTATAPNFKRSGHEPSSLSSDDLDKHIRELT
jgi:hypothetical protein